jgi:hypothetical protein
MNCTEFRTALEIRQPAKPVTPEISGHLDACRDPQCRQVWEDARLLDPAIAAWRKWTPRANCTETVVARWRQERRPHVRSQATSLNGDQSGWSTRRSGSTAVKSASRAPWLALASVVGLFAAVAVLSAGPASMDNFVDHRPGHRHHDPVLDEGAPLIAMAETPAPEQAMQDVGMTYVGVAQNATRIVTDFVMLTLGDSDEIEDPSVDREWIEQWSEQLEPVGEGVDEAVDGLLESFPDTPSI